MKSASTIAAVLRLLFLVSYFCSLHSQVPSDYPQNVHAAALSPTDIMVTWVAIPPSSANAQDELITHYEVQFNQSTFDDIPATDFVPTAGLTTAFCLQNLEEYVEYSISIRGYGTGGPGPFSPPVTNTTLEDAPSSPPNDLRVENVSASELQLTWEKPDDIDINGQLRNYIIHYSRVDQPQSVSVISVSGDSLSRVLRGLDCFTNYSVSVAAFTVQQGPFAMATGTTSEQIPGSPPQNVHAESSSPISITIEWEPPPADALNGILRGYRIRYIPTGNLAGTVTTSLIAVDHIPYTVENLEPLMNYSIEVVAVTIEEGPYSTPIYVTTQQMVDAECFIVSDLEISSVRQPNAFNTVTVEFMWTGPSDQLMSSCSHSYNLTYTAQQTSPYPVLRSQGAAATVKLDGNQRGFIVEEGLPYALYTATVTAYDAESGTAGSEATSSIRTQAIEPTAVTNLSAAATGSESIHVIWDLPLYPNGPISHYVVYYRTSDTVQLPPISSNGYVLITQSGNSTELEVTELDTVTTYAIHVQAVGMGSQGILPGIIDEEILQQTEEVASMQPPSHSSLTGAVVAGVVTGAICLVTVFAVAVVLIICLVMRNKRSILKLQYQLRRDSGAVALDPMTSSTTELTFAMSDCVAYEHTQNDHSNPHHHHHHHQRQDEAGAEYVNSHGWELRGSDILDPDYETIPI